ncbi:hypothetical protein [[Mycoplasma] gypis]|uniref:hypothetical protein n=1 Tax=[Mycoplasma] gypis TaxID=92404 RepID=UPI0019674168|nr:hypothetical protein [[Mycoplasma] gypis]MBN0919038.1 hypothetical protein [[Mycoplasma] gypis]
MEKKELNEKLIEYFDAESKKVSKKIKIDVFFQSLFDAIIILINLSIIGIASYAIHLGRQRIESLKEAGQFSEKINEPIVLTITVAVFTILIFIFAIIQSIYKSFAKTYTYKKMYESLEYISKIFINMMKISVKKTI